MNLNVFAFLDWLNDWTADAWKTPYLWAAVLVLLLLSVLPTAATIAIGVVIGLVLAYGDPQITIFGRTFGDEEDEDAD